MSSLPDDEYPGAGHRQMPSAISTPPAPRRNRPVDDRFQHYPLSCLLRIGKADLLEKLYGSIAIPKAVAIELDLGQATHGDWRNSLPFVREIEPATDNVLCLLEAEVDAGEAAAIALALQTKSDLLIIDDLAGRRSASRLNLNITGTVGVILAATDLGLIEDPFVVLEELRDRGGLWLSERFLKELLHSQPN